MIGQLAGQRRSPSYGDERFDALTDLAWAMAGGSRGMTAAAAVARHPASLRHMWAVLRLPVADIHAPRRELRDWQDNKYLPALRTRYSGRRAQAVLDLPPSHAVYMAGRHRQALRTNASRARRLGIQTRMVPSYEEWTPFAAAVLAKRPGGEDVVNRLCATGAGGRVRLFEATSRDGDPVAVAAAALIGDAACLMALLSDPDHPVAGPTRYLLHSTMVEDLIGMRQRHIVVGSALRQTTGLQYFQHLLGYRPANLRLVCTDKG